MDLYHLDFPDDTFDAVVSMAAFEFINDNEKTLYEFMCVVKPGGKVLVGALTGNSSWGEEYKSHMWREDSVFRHAAFKTAEEMRGFLQPYFLANAESVFLPYTITEDRTTKEWDDYYRQQGEVGAFVCCLWQKPNI